MKESLKTHKDIARRILIEFDEAVKKLFTISHRITAQTIPLKPTITNPIPDIKEIDSYTHLFVYQRYK